MLESISRCAGADSRPKLDDKHARSYRCLAYLAARASDPAPVTATSVKMTLKLTSKCGLFGVLGPEARGLAGVLLVGLTECDLLLRQLISLRQPDIAY
jgi:hypothetical protein